MPSTSAKQHRLMEAVAHSPGFAKKAGIPQKVGKDFAKADDKAGITKSHGGHMVRHKEAGATYRQLAAKHGVSKSTAHRRVMKQGYSKMGSASD